MSLVTTLSEVCEDLVRMLQLNADVLGIAEGGVYYGDQQRIPVAPSVAVEPNEKRVELYGAGRMTEITLAVFLLVYSNEISNVQSNRGESDKLAEGICNLVNADATFGGKAIHCFVSNVSSGYSTKTNTTLRSSRITFEVKSQERLPNSP